MSNVSHYKPKLNPQPEFSTKPKHNLLCAAVALLLRNGESGTEILMMQRAKDAQDPWSGQMAFPGGKIDANDHSAKAAAIRETYEEVNVALDETKYIGQLDDLYGFRVKQEINVVVSSFVFQLTKQVELRGNYEVAELVWIPLSLFNDPTRVCKVPHPRSPNDKFSGLLIDEAKNQIVWGLSLRILLFLFDVLKLPMDTLSYTEVSTNLK